MASKAVISRQLPVICKAACEQQHFAFESDSRKLPAGVLWVGRMTMSQYVFLCTDCNKEFTQTLHISDVEKAEVMCPHCGSKRVTQEVAAFSAVTSKKS
jgi:putative FmdB family regulatory protein